jgi:hypothetical protein
MKSASAAGAMRTVTGDVAVWVDGPGAVAAACDLCGFDSNLTIAALTAPLDPTGATVDADLLNVRHAAAGPATRALARALCALARSALTRSRKYVSANETMPNLWTLLMWDISPL